MTPDLLSFASGACAGTGIGLMIAAQYYSEKLIRNDRNIAARNKALAFSEAENDRLRDVIADQRRKLSKWANLMTVNAQYGKMGKPSQETQMCGGCGAYLTQEEIVKCPGETCPRYAEGSLPLFPTDHVGPRPPEVWPLRESDERKINIGYTGRLHTSKKPLV